MVLCNSDLSPREMSFPKHIPWQAEGTEKKPCPSCWTREEDKISFYLELSKRRAHFVQPSIAIHLRWHCLATVVAHHSILQTHTGLLPWWMYWKRKPWWDLVINHTCCHRNSCVPNVATATVILYWEEYSVLHLCFFFFFTPFAVPHFLLCI